MAEIVFPVAPVFKPLLRPARYLGAHGGRGSGKSHFFAEKLLARSLVAPVRAVCIREIQRSLSASVMQLLADKIRRFGLGELFNVTNNHIDMPHGGRALFLGMQNHTADAVKSLEGADVAWVEEAQSLSQSSLNVLRPTLRKPGSELWFSWNAVSPRDPVDKLLRTEKPKNSIVVEANYGDNPWFPEILREEMEHDRSRDVDKWRHVWCGEYQRQSQSRVFHNWRVEEFESTPDAIYYHGADWGFSQDPTVLVRCVVVGRTLYVEREAWAVGCDLVDTPGLFDKLDDRWGSTRRWTVVADSSNPQAISHMRKSGYHKMVASVKGVGSVEDGINFLKSYDIVVHPRCEHVIDELSEYSFVVDKRTEQVTPMLADKKNHTIDALRYAVEPLRRTQARVGAGSY